MHMGIWDEIRFKLHGLIVRLGIRTYSLRYLEKWILLGSITGIIGGLSAIAFYYLLDFFTNIFEIIGEQLAHISPFLAPLIVGLGGLIVGPIIFFLAPEAAGHGTDAVIQAFHERWGIMRTRVPVIKVLASSITIGSGGSAGREGPIAQISAGLASLIAKFLRLRVPDRKIILVCGIASGIGSIFKSPLGAALFSVEVLYKRDLEIHALIPAIVSSVVGYSVYASHFGWEPVLFFPECYFVHLIDLPLFIILGIVCGLLALFYVKIFYGVTALFMNKLNCPNFIKPGIGGLITGIIAIFMPQVLGMGYEGIEQCFSASLPIEAMLPLAFGKILATSFTIGSGGSGGVFAPSLFIGAMIGGSLGHFYSKSLSWALTDIPIFSITGMAAFFAGAAKVPLTSIVMTCEMTGNYSLLLPLMLAVSSSYIIAGEESIYESQLRFSRERVLTR